MNGKRIFIVEDEQIVMLDLQQRLARLGYEIVGKVASGDEALRQIEKAKPDLVLMDIKIRGKIDGIELAEVMHSKYGLLVIFVTAYSDSKTIARIKASSVCGFILKPFTDEELRVTVEIGLHEHELEVSLKQSEEQYRRLFDDAPAGYHEIDLKGNLVRANRTELEMLGYEADEMIGRPVWDFVEEHDAAREAVMEKLGTGKIGFHPFERNYLRRNGRPIPVLIKDFPIRADNGALLGIRSAILDISVLKEEQTRAASFFAIAEKSTSGVIITGHKGLVRYLNPAAEELLGMRRVVQGKSALKDADPKETLPAIVEESTNGIVAADQKEFRRHVNAVIERILKHNDANLLGSKPGAPIEQNALEIDIVRAGGGPGTGEVRVVHTTWEGELAYLISVYDVTERKKVTEELRKIDQMKTNFVSTVSHELRTPLAIMKEGLSLVLDRIPGQINEKQEIILTAVKNNIDRLARIINEILDVSKIEAGEVKLKIELVNIVDKAKEVVASFAAQAQNKGLELKTSFSSPAINIYVDPDKIAQIFINLINNALRFTEKGCIKIQIKELKNEVKCLVADTGIGISEDNLSKVFSKFQQFDRVDGPGDKGTGLGLSIVKNLVEMHKGKIRVESKRGGGTKFIFILPKNKNKLRNNSGNATAKI